MLVRLSGECLELQAKRRAGSQSVDMEEEVLCRMWTEFIVPRGQCREQ